MWIGKPKPLIGQSLKRITINAIALLILLPAVSFLYLFQVNPKGQWVVAAFALIISLLGFLLLWMIVSGISRLLHGLEGIARGESDSIALEQGPAQLREMAEIVNALNQITAEFQENTRQLEQFVQQFAMLTELTEITARIPDIGQLLSLVLKKTMGAASAQKGSVMLIREDGSGIDRIATEGWQHKEKELSKSRFSPAARVIETGEALLVEDVADLPELAPGNDDDRYSSPSFLILPLKAKTTTIGAVCLSEKAGRGRFNDRDRQFLTLLLGQVGYAVENARLLQQARGAADALKRMIDNKNVELKDAQKQILQAEKLSALGQLIAGVAHEMNNPLTTVVGYTGMVLESSDKNTPKVERQLKTVFQEANRTTKIVQNLLSFARAKKSEKGPVDLNQIIQTIVSLREYDLRTRAIDFTCNLDRSLPITMIDADQIQQVLLNLVNNAAQAMSSEGPRKIQIGSRREGDFALLWVKDNGHGMPEAVVEKIFEPFFSTKGSNTNTGLGLSVSYGIVKEHGGEILVDSQLGAGTQMTLRLPLVEPPPGTRTIMDLDAIDPPRVENKTALVVDDEPHIAELVAELLEMIGFEVEACTSGPAALERLLDKDFEIVVCDNRMPEMSGQQLYHAIRTARPRNVKGFVMTSGDVADPQTKLFATNHEIPLIAKPFTKQELWQAAQQTVERSES